MQHNAHHASAHAQSSAGNGILERLELIQRIIEDRFVAAGDILLQSLEGTGELIGSLDTLGKTFDSKIVATTQVDLAVAAAKLCTLPAYHAKHVEAVSRLSCTREKLVRHISEMRCSLSVIAAYTSNAKQVADATGDVGLTRLANGMADCIAESASELHALEDDLVALRRALGDASIHGEILERKISKLLPTVPDELTAAAKVVGSHYEAVSAATEQVSRIANNTKECVARVLAALQFGDITRQRIEHVQASIIKIEADAALEPPDIQNRIKATCYALLARQLSEINIEFELEAAEIEWATAEMAGDASKLLQLHDIAFDRDGGRNSGFLHVLTTRIDVALSLISKIEAADAAATETGRVTIAAAHKLSARIANIQAIRDHMYALTQHAAEHGNNCPLSIIAREIQTQCRLLEEAARVGLGILDTLLQLTSTITGCGGARQPQDSSATAAAAALTIAARHICAARDITETDLAEVAAKGEVVVDMLTLSVGRLGLRQEISAILSLAADDAARLAEGGYEIEDEIPDSIIRFLDDIARHYTMARERNVHDSFLDALAITHANADGLAEGNDADSVLF